MNLKISGILESVFHSGFPNLAQASVDFKTPSTTLQEPCSTFWRVDAIEKSVLKSNCWAKRI